jgi:hypothetical protein
VERCGHGVKIYYLKFSFFEIKSEIKVKKKGKVKISLLQAVEAPRVARGQGSHIT